MSTAQTITMQRVLSGVPTLALFLPPRRNAVRVKVLRRGEWVDITNRVRRGTINELNNEAMLTLNLELLNGVGFPSLAPRRIDSELNWIGEEYVPLLWPGHQIFVEAASSEDGSTPSQWVPVFHGVLGDGIDATSQPHVVSIFCRDYIATWLMDDHIVGPLVYEKMYASQIIQQLLIDRYQAGALPGLIPFRVIGEDDHWIDRYNIQNQTAWQAIQNIVDQSGWDCRCKLDESDGQFKLTYWLPDRDMSKVDWIIDKRHIRQETYKVTNSNVRNRVEVEYRDPSGQRRIVVAERPRAEGEGIRLCRIGEADTSLIRDEAAAQRFADRVLSYVKDLHATDELELPFNPYISLFDKIEVPPTKVRSIPERYAVDSRTLEFSADSWRLSLIASGSVGVRPQVWINKETRPGVKRPWEPSETSTLAPMPAPTGVSAEGIPGGIRITYDRPDPQRWAETRVYVSTTSPVDLNGAPRLRTRDIPVDVPGLTPGVTYYARLVHVDAYGNESPAGPEVSAVPQAIHETPNMAPPATPAGLSYDFGGPDLYVRWSPVERAVAYRVRISDATRVRREVHVAGSSYTYAYADNVYDGSGTPAAALTVEVWARTREGVYSVQPAQVQAVNAAPEKPAVVVESSLTQLRWRITSPLPLDLREVRVTAGNYTETSTATYGTVSLREAGIADGASAQVTVVLVDAFGQESEPQTATVTGRYLSVEDMAGAIFQIQAEVYNGADESWAPDVGELPMLWDGDTQNYVFWQDENMDKGPLRIVFRYPTTWFFDMVRFHSLRYTYTVEAEIDGQWTKVAEGVSESGWTIKRFDRMVLTRALRLTLIDNIEDNFGYYITELKFWTITMADEILAQKLRLTGDMAIVNNDGTVQFTSQGIEIGSVDQGSTLLSPGGLVFNRPDGSRSGYVRAIVPGVAQDGEYVPLNFINDPVVILSPARATVHNPAVNGIQKLRLEVTEVSPDGFRVVAKLLRHDGPGQRIVFPNTERYRWSTRYDSSWCTDGGHVELADEPRAWSEHRLRDVGDRKVFTTASGTTGVVIRIREMLHVHAWAGNYYAKNSISYRLRIRPVGSGSWTRTVGPITRSIETVSSLIATRLSYRHSQLTYVINDLAPDEYELEIEVTGKSLSPNGANGADAMYLLIEEIEEMQEQEIPTPEPIIVHYVAFESDSPGHDVED